MGGVFTSDDAVGARYMRVVLTANDSLGTVLSYLHVRYVFVLTPCCTH